jgi:hypothetical protein
MSEARVAGLVCEGQTDVPILRTALQVVWPELEEVRCLQPELDETDRAKGPSGWSLVKSWCEAHAGKLDEVLDPDVGDPIDLLVVAIDVDIAIDAGIADPPREVGQYEAKRLHSTIGAWLSTASRRRIPTAVMFATPVMAIEAWVIAALFPKEKAPERIANPAEWLAKRKKLRYSTLDGKPWKELYRYKDFSISIANRLPHVRKVCKEAERVLHLVEQRRAHVGDA